MKCVIPCAGMSSRMAFVPKHLLQVQGTPLIEHVVASWPGAEFIFVLHPSMTYMWELLPKGCAVVFQEEPLGLADAILRAEPFLDGEFTVSLGDCLFRGEWGHRIPRCPGVGVWMTSDLRELNKSYLVEAREGQVVRLSEKPGLTVVDEPMACGMGVYFLPPWVFAYIRRRKASAGGGDFTYVLQDMVDDGAYLQAVQFEGSYVNVGSPEDLGAADTLVGAMT